MADHRDLLDVLLLQQRLGAAQPPQAKVAERS
jgi:hypothetical protein